MLNKYYVYAYLDPRRASTDPRFIYEPFYIGRGTGSRFNCHMKEVHKLPDSVPPSMFKEKRINMIKINKIRSILNSGYQPVIIKIYDLISFEESKRQEAILISELGRSIFGEGPLTNLTAGGEGRHVCHAGRFNPFYGKSHSPEFRQRMSELHKGKIITEEHKLIISTKLKGVRKSNEFAEKKRAYMRKLHNEDPSNPILTRLGKLNSKKWRIQTPDGEIIDIISLRQFCKDNGLNNKTLLSAYRANRATQSGWRVLDVT